MLKRIRELLNRCPPILNRGSTTEEQTNRVLDRVLDLSLGGLGNWLDIELSMLIVALDNVSDRKQLKRGASQLKNLIDFVAKELLPGLLVESLDVNAVGRVNHDRLCHDFGMQQLHEVKQQVQIERLEDRKGWLIRLEYGVTYAGDLEPPGEERFGVDDRRLFLFRA